MRRPSGNFTSFLTAVLVAACASAPRVNVQSESAAIAARNRDLLAAIAAKDAAGVSAFYAQDAVLLMPNVASLQGREAIRRSWNGMLGMPNFRFSFNPTRIDVAAAGDMAVDVGTYTLSFDGPQGRVDDRGNYTTGWRKIDGQWMITTDMANSVLPLPVAQPVVAVVEMDQAQMLGSAGMQWTDLAVPGFPPGLKMAVVHGDPSKAADYTLRLRFPDGYVFPPHWHPGAEHVTVLTGTFMLGMGDRYDASALKSYAPGDFIYAPPKMSHFGTVRGETTVQLHGTGPFAINLTKPAS